MPCSIRQSKERNLELVQGLHLMVDLVDPIHLDLPVGFGDFLVLEIVKLGSSRLVDLLVCPVDIGLHSDQRFEP